MTDNAPLLTTRPLGWIVLVGKKAVGCTKTHPTGWLAGNTCLLRPGHRRMRFFQSSREAHDVAISFRELTKKRVIVACVQANWPKERKRV